MTTDSSEKKTSEAIAKYKTLTQEYVLMQERESVLLGELDCLWWAMADWERDIIDPEGAKFRQSGGDGKARA